MAITRFRVNRHVITGNLTADPKFHEFVRQETGEVRYLSIFRIAHNEEFPVNGEQQKRTTFFNIKYGLSKKAKEYFEERLYKGCEVYVEGPSRMDLIEDETGSRPYHYIQAEQLDIIAEPRSRNNVEGNAPPPNGARSPEPAPSRMAPLDPYPAPAPSPPAAPPPPRETRSSYPGQSPQGQRQNMQPLPDDANSRLDTTRW